MNTGETTIMKHSLLSYFHINSLCMNKFGFIFDLSVIYPSQYEKV